MHCVPEHQILGIQVDLCASRSREGNCLTNVIVVTVSADDSYNGASIDGGEDGVEFVRRVDHDDLVVITDEPHVVVDIPRAAIEGERSARHQSFNAGLAHRTTTERRTSP